MDHRPLIALVALFAFGCSDRTTEEASQSATEPFVFGEVRTVRSEALGQERTLNVYLPDGYRDSTLAYPVIYVLDGSADEDFPHIAGLAQFMNMYGLLPKSIVVGIANEGRSRYRDFTSPTQSDSDRVWLPTGGGSATFIDFMEREVQPFIKEQYRTSGHRTIIGQSLGGLLGAEILFAKPELFDDYILVSPSLWWNNGEQAHRAVAWMKEHGSLPKRVFIAVAKDDDMMMHGIEEVVMAMDSFAAPPFAHWYVPFPEETHATILHRSVYQAFELLNGQAR